MYLRVKWEAEEIVQGAAEKRAIIKTIN